MPGLKTNKDSMPNIRKIKAGTTSGLMLSSGYGGVRPISNTWDFPA